jgi:uncharacterized protein YaiI (UPF0178 family)
MTLYIDADACPVKEEALRVARRHSLPVIVVSNRGLRPSGDPLVRQVVVSDAFDAADNWIAQHANAGDIVVTADVPLASRCVKAGAQVLGPTGRPFTPTNIGMASAMRDLKAHLRETGADRGFNASFTKDDRSRFLQVLEEMVRKRPSV